MFYFFKKILSLISFPIVAYPALCHSLQKQKCNLICYVVSADLGGEDFARATLISSHTSSSFIGQLIQPCKDSLEYP